MRTIMTAHFQCSASLSQDISASLSKNLSRAGALDAEGDTEVEVEEEDEEDARVLDRLCLALGLLTNLVQVSDAANDIIRKTRKHPNPHPFFFTPLKPTFTYYSLSTGISPTCTGKRTCIQACQCSRRVSALDCLAQVYIQQTKDSNNTDDNIDPGANFLRGHLTVLLGLLMRGGKANQKVLLATALPGSSNRSKLAALAEQAREFVTFYAQLAVRLAVAAQGKADDDADDDDNEIPHSDDHNVDRMVKDGNNGQVAQEVIFFLEKLSARQR
jgi:hypothetical protein